MKNKTVNTQHEQVRINARTLLLKRFFRSKSGVIGFVIVMIMVCVAVFAELLAPYSYKKMLFEGLLGPNSVNFMGTDDFGRDYFSRIVYGARVSLGVGFLSTILATCIGVPIGAISGYFGGRIDNIIMRVVDVFLAFPFYLLAIMMVAVLGPSRLRVLARHARRPGRLVAVATGALASQLLYFYAVRDVGVAVATLITLGLAPVALTCT